MSREFDPFFTFGSSQEGVVLPSIVSPAPVIDSGKPEDTLEIPPSHVIQRHHNTSTIHKLVSHMHPTLDKKIAQYIDKLPEGWNSTTITGEIINKQQLQRCKWGALKDNLCIRQFQRAIILAHPPHAPVAQFDTLLTTSIHQGSDVWERRVVNTLDDNILPHPLCNQITIFQIFHNHHFTTLVTDNHTYYYIDSLHLPPPPSVYALHQRLRRWYAHQEHIPEVLTHDTPHIQILETPTQTDGWTCSMHMLLSSTSRWGRG